MATAGRDSTAAYPLLLALGAAGLADVEIRETHRVHAQAASALIRARKPTR